MTSHHGQQPALAWPGWGRALRRLFGCSAVLILSALVALALIRWGRYIWLGVCVATTGGAVVAFAICLRTLAFGGLRWTRRLAKLPDGDRPSDTVGRWFHSDFGPLRSCDGPEPTQLRVGGRLSLFASPPLLLPLVGTVIVQEWPWHLLPPGWHRVAGAALAVGCVALALVSAMVLFGLLFDLVAGQAWKKLCSLHPREADAVGHSWWRLSHADAQAPMPPAPGPPRLVRREARTGRWVGLLVASVACVGLLSSESGWWLLTRLGNSVTAYRRYQWALPAGDHAREASARAERTLAPGRDLRQRMMRLKSTDEFSFAMDEFSFARGLADEIFSALCSLEPGDDGVLWSAGGAAPRDVDTLCELLSCEFSRTGERGPPFRGLTLLVAYSETETGTYTRRRADDKSATPGSDAGVKPLRATTEMGLYLPGAANPVWSWSHTSTSPAQVTVRDGTDVEQLVREAVEQDMKRAIDGVKPELAVLRRMRDVATALPDGR